MYEKLLSLLNQLLYLILNVLGSNKFGQRCVEEGRDKPRTTQTVWGQSAQGPNMDRECQGSDQAV